MFKNDSRIGSTKNINPSINNTSHDSWIDKLNYRSSPSPIPIDRESIKIRKVVLWSIWIRDYMSILKHWSCSLVFWRLMTLLVLIFYYFVRFDCRDNYKLLFARFFIYIVQLVYNVSMRFSLGEYTSLCPVEREREREREREKEPSYGSKAAGCLFRLVDMDMHRLLPPNYDANFYCILIRSVRLLRLLRGAFRCFSTIVQLLCDFLPEFFMWYIICL